jgi:hypothetical protein
MSAIAVRLPPSLRTCILVTAFAEAIAGRQVNAQASYRNLDAGFPVRIEDAAATERYALDLDLLNFRYDELSGLRTRFQYEPRISYGILPRTEAWLRVAAFYRERDISPRKGIAGVGLGGMYQLTQETLRLPAVAVASETFFPTGPNALPASYSVKTLFTRSVSSARIHLNASIASYAARLVPADCQPLPGGTVCGGGGGGGGGALPPLDGPCAIGPGSPLSVSISCAAPASSPSESSVSQAAPGELATHAHWMVGLAVDKTLPLRSIVVVGDLFAERFEGIGRKTDLTAELGARRQLTPTVVLVGGVSRHFRGVNGSSFLILGATFSRAVQGFWRHL